MAYYFSIPHLGAGSLEVESLGSYFSRMALAHGCTQWQLAHHMRVWWEATHATSSKMSFPRAFFSDVKNTQPCGYGNRLGDLVDVLEVATGVTTLRSGTLLCLRNVAARTALRTIRSSRAWCPVCYEEDQAKGEEPYDRLLWAIVPIKRCVIHKIELLDCCPACSSPQFHITKPEQLCNCTACGKSLVTHSRDCIPAVTPTLGERLIHDLVKACAENPSLELNWHSISTFFRKVRNELPRKDPLRNSKAFLHTGRRPALSSLLRMATTLNVHLLDFQTREAPSISYPLYGPEPLLLDAHRQARLPKSTRVRVERELREALEDEGFLPPFRSFCVRLQVSTGYVRYHFQSLVRDYMKRRGAVRKASFEEYARAAEQALDAGLMTAYLEGRITQRKELIREVAWRAGVSIPTARKAVWLKQRERSTAARRSGARSKQ